MTHKTIHAREVSAALYEYDAVGNLIQRTDRNGRSTQYDNLYRPVEERWLDSCSATIRMLSYTDTDFVYD